MICAWVAAAVLLRQEPEALELKQSIPLPGVKGRIDHLAWDAKGKRVFIAALGNGTVEVVDVAKGKVVRGVEGLREPQGILFLAASNQLVVACGGDGSCRFYDADSLRLLDSVDCREDADNARFDAAGRGLYVGYGGGGLAVVDVATRRRISEIKLDGHPESFQLESQGTRIFVNVPRARHVAVVDRGKGAVTATWKLSADANFPMAL